MSIAASGVESRAESRIDRAMPWVAALVSALVHLLMLLLLLYASKPIVTTPQGAAAGSRMKVDFVGETQQRDEGPPSPPPPAALQPRPAASSVRSTLVRESPDPVPPPDVTADPGSSVAPTPQDVATQSQARRPAASPPGQRRPETWTGRPPGLLAQDTAPVNAGMSNSPATDDGSQNDTVRSAEPSMEVGGYQVIYDLRSETLLRAWKAQGMTELSIPLPGTQYRMVCPLEIAIKRGSGKCRLVDPYSPEMQAIGDGREVINMVQVYRRGELVWRGPGPYR